MPAIPLTIVKAAITDRKLRSGLRLFYWFKANCEHTFFLDNELIKRLSHCFSRYEIQTALKYLKEKNFVNVDKTGRHFLQGAAFYRINFNITEKKYAVRQIEESDLADRLAWKRFIFGTAVAAVYRRVKNTTKKIVRESLTVLKNVEDTRSGLPGLIPLSLACIMSLGVSQTTASAMRKQAAAGGHISNQHQFVKFTTAANPDGIKATYKEWLQIRGDMAIAFGAEEASKIVWKKGMLLIQLPNLVAPNFRFERRRTNKKGR